MRIEQVNIRSFGILRGYSETFSAGVNIIEGGNETGKSTLAAFILYMLYGFDDRGGVLSEREKRINWVTGTADGSMTISVGEHRYRIDRRTERLGSGASATYVDTCTMTDLATETPVNLTLSPGETLLGVGKELYESTAYLGQLADAGDTTGDMRTSVENLMFSGDEKINTTAAIARLAEARDRLLAPDHMTGRIVEVRGRADNLSARLAGAVRGQRELIVLGQKYEDEASRLAEAQRRLREMQEVRVAFANHQILTSFEQLHSMETQSRDIEAEIDNYCRDNSYGGFFPTEDYAADLALKRRLYTDAHHAFEESDSTLRELEGKQVATRDIQKNMQRADKHGGEAQVLARHSILHRKAMTFALSAIGTGLLFVLLAVLGIMRFLSPKAEGADALAIVALAFSGLFFVAALVLAFLAINRHEAERAYCIDYGAKNAKELRYRMQMVSECRAESVAHTEELRRARDRAEDTRSAYFSARAVLDETLGVWGKTLPTTEVENFLDIFEGTVRNTIVTHRNMCERREALDSAVAVLAASLSALNEDEIRALVPEENRPALAETTAAEIEEGIRYFTDQTTYFTASTEDLKGRLETLRAATENPAELSEHLASANSELDRLRDRYQALDAALAALTGADIRLRAELSPRLARYARDLMDVMTDGKYTGVDVGDDLRLDVTTEGVSLSAEALSGGTRDIAYITLRLALVRLLYQETPPLCFDESLAHQDNDRCYTMLKVFLTLSERNGLQTFLFTCRSREYTIASEIGGECRRIQLI